MTRKFISILNLILQNLVLTISFTLGFCFHVASHVCETNKLKTVHTLQLTMLLRTALVSTHFATAQDPISIPFPYQSFETILYIPGGSE